MPSSAVRRSGAAPASATHRLSSWRRILLVWILLTVAVTLVTTSQHIHAHGHSVVGTDFHIYWDAGRLANAGRDSYAPLVRHLGFVYPPVALLPFQLLGHLSLPTAFEVWTVLTSALLAAVVAVALRRGAPVLALLIATVAILFSGYSRHHVELGQVGWMLLAMVVCDVMLCEGRRGQGLLTGLAIGIKFTPAVFVLWFAARRQWRAVLMTGVGFAASVLVGALTAPAASRLYWRRLLVDHRLGVGVPSQLGAANNQSLTNAVVLIFGHGALGVGRVVALLLTLAGLLAGILAARRSAWLAIALLGTASCLATSSTWDHHYVWMFATVVALAAGELRQLPATSVATVLWTLWGLTRWWQKVVHTSPRRYNLMQMAAAVATPTLAALFVLVAVTELWGLWRRDRRAGAVENSSGPPLRSAKP